MKYLAFFLLLTTFGFAQTRLIYHKSHSGKAENFLTATSNNLFYTNNSNLGHAPIETVKNANLDSLIYLDNNRVVMVTSEVCSNLKRNNVAVGHSSVWKAGKDTLVGHKLFTQKHQLDSIKKELKEKYHFKNNIDSVKFLGYDNKVVKKSKKKKSLVIPVSDTPKFPTGMFIVVVSALIFLMWRLWSQMRRLV